MTIQDLRENLGRIALAALVVGGSGALLYAAWLASDDQWGLSVLAGLGTTLLLALPLIFLERRFENRVTTEVGRVEQAQKSTGETLGELQSNLQAVQRSVGDVTERVEQINLSPQDRAQQRRQARRNSALAPALNARDGTFRHVFDALKQGSETAPAAIESTIYVPAAGGKWVLGFSARDEPERICVTVAPYDGKSDTATYEWVEGETIDDAIDGLDAILLETLGDAGAPVLNENETVLDDLAELLIYGQERILKTGKASPPKPLRQWPTEHWLITRRTLEHVDQPTAVYKSPDVIGGDPPAQAPDHDELLLAWPIAKARFVRHVRDPL